MNRYSSRPPPIIIPNRSRKFEDHVLTPADVLSAGGLSPDVQISPPVFPNVPCSPPCSSPVSSVSQIGQYILTKPLEDNLAYLAVHANTQETFICKVISISKYHESLAAYWAIDSHENIQEIHEIILGSTNAYVFFHKNIGDLHSYIRSKKCLKEREAKNLFQQVVMALQHCHDNGIILRDLKLRKFTFTNHDRTCLQLGGLDDARVLKEPDDDTLSEKHGCPAYVSPEILNNSSYSGKQADMWSVGVILYTMLYGRYPFHDIEPRSLFDKIRQGRYLLPDTVSTKAKCLLRSLLRYNPDERLTAETVLKHPWFKNDNSSSKGLRIPHKYANDQLVPDIDCYKADSIFS